MKTAFFAFAFALIFTSISGATVLKCHSVVTDKNQVKGGDQFILDTSKEPTLAIPVTDDVGCLVDANGSLVTMQVGKLFNYMGDWGMQIPMAKSETHGAILDSSIVTAFPKPGLSVMCICYEIK